MVDRAPEIQASSNSVYHVVDDEVEGPGRLGPGAPTGLMWARQLSLVVPGVGNLGWYPAPALVWVTTDHRATARASTQDVPRAPAAFQAL